MMEIMNGSYIDSEVLSYTHSTINANDVAKPQSSMDISSTGNEEDVVVEPCEDDERVCIFQLRGVTDGHFTYVPECWRISKS